MAERALAKVTGMASPMRLMPMVALVPCTERMAAGSTKPPRCVPVDVPGTTHPGGNLM